MGALPDNHFALLSVYALLYDYGVWFIPHSAQINLQNTLVIQFTNGVYFLNFFLSGYATHLVGKWHLGFYKWPYVPTNRGFDSAYGFWDGAEDHYDHTRDKVVDFRNGTEPVLDLNGKYATFEYVKV